MLLDSNAIRARYAALGLLGGLSVAPLAAAACAKAPVAAADFSVRGAPLPSAVAIRDGALSLGVPAGQFGALLDAHPSATKAEFCAEISAPPGGDDRDAGIAFWAARAPSGAPSSFYAFSVGPRGNWVVERAQDQHVHLIASGPATSSNTSGAAPSHEVRVQVDGRLAVLTLDGKKLASFEGAPPAGAAYAGLFGEASAQVPTPCMFENIHTGTH
jgi:hypothetical protein